MKKICVIGQLPPPIHGLSKALDILVHSTVIKKKYLLEVIDIKNNKKFIKNHKRIKDSNADVYYFTISQSTLGNVRDMIILNTILKKNKKIIIHYHGGYYKCLFDKMSFLQKYVNKKLLSQIDALIVLSESLKEIFVDVISPQKVRICENFVETSSLLNPVEFQQKINVIDQKKKIEVLYLSNFIKTKGYYDLLNAVRYEKCGNVIYNFAGAFLDPKNKLEFENFIEENNLQDKVMYHGIVEGDKKKSLLYNSDIFVLPTYYPKEGQPISIIEAMGNGLGIVTTRHAGIPDIVSEKNGHVVNIKSPKEIQLAIDKFVGDRELLKSISVNNREVTLNKYKESDYIGRLDKIFDEVLNNAN
ncbi:MULTISPECIES: glycosyltransferase family 4 protein [Priestia]|uniref:glycosyltransferase family 4 protein n=1 Tax=Priestia TaxID=2800373 RepID=UPI001125F9ED|nr:MULTISPECIES: glycosyltransferase family 4 protein [Priestia]